METLFWSSFGIIILEQLDIVESHGPTKWTGRTILGCYCCCSVIVLLNMLIAMMSNSYQDIYVNKILLHFVILLNYLRVIYLTFCDKFEFLSFIYPYPSILIILSSVFHLESSRR